MAFGPTDGSLLSIKYKGRGRAGAERGPGGSEKTENLILLYELCIIVNFASITKYCFIMMLCNKKTTSTGDIKTKEV